eukprot:1177137-Prorocentrum_minimum.AAC.2
MDMRQTGKQFEGRIRLSSGYVLHSIIGSTVDGKGSTVDGKGSTLDVKGSTVDVKGSTADVQGLTGTSLVSGAFSGAARECSRRESNSPAAGWLIEDLYGRVEPCLLPARPPPSLF